MRVFLRHHHGLVPEQLLHRLQIHAGHHQARSKGVPQVVPSEIPDVSFLYRVLEPAAPVPLLGAPGLRGDECRAFRDAVQRQQRAARVGIDGDEPAARFSVGFHDPALQAHLVPLQPELLAAAHARGKCEIELPFAIGTIEADDFAEGDFLLFIEEAQAAGVLLQPLHARHRIRWHPFDGHTVRENAGDECAVTVHGGPGKPLPPHFSEHGAHALCPAG